MTGNGLWGQVREPMTAAGILIQEGFDPGFEEFQAVARHKDGEGQQYRKVPAEECFVRKRMSVSRLRESPRFFELRFVEWSVYGIK